jgi:hypothetical protein
LEGSIPSPLRSTWARFHPTTFAADGKDGNMSSGPSMAQDLAAIQYRLQMMQTELSVFQLRLAEHDARVSALRAAAGSNRAGSVDPPLTEIIRPRPTACSEVNPG